MGRTYATKIRRQALRSTMTTNDPSEIIDQIDQTENAVRDSVAPLADKIVRNAIGAELRRAYDNAMDDLQLIAAVHESPWKAPEPVRLGQVVQEQGAIEGQAAPEQGAIERGRQ